MVKLLCLLALAAVGCKILVKRWPWELMGLSLPRRDQSSAEQRRARNLLGINANANRIEILEAHKQLIAVIHPDRGGTSEQVHEANAARDLLLASAAPRIPE